MRVRKILEGIKMAQTKYIKCPHCKQKELGPYTVDSSSVNRTKGNCPHCGKRYVIEYGKGKIKATKE